MDLWRVSLLRLDPFPSEGLLTAASFLKRQFIFSSVIIFSIFQHTIHDGQTNCILCASPGRLCASCKSIAYCSIECQQTDWPLHKLLCKKLSSFSTRPSPASKLGLLFPPDSKVPKLIWVKCEEHQLEYDENVFDLPHPEPYLGPGNPHPEEKPISHNVFRSIDLDHTVVVYCRDNFSNDGSKPNMSIIETTEGTMPVQWAGPIVVISKIGMSSNPYARCQDITLGDLRVAVDYFMSYGANQINSFAELDEIMTNHQLSSEKKKPRKCVRINCNGDRFVNRRKKYEEVNIPHDHPVYKEKPTSISKLLSMPILVWKYPADKAWKDSEIAGVGRYDNQSATFLNLNADPTSDQWGWAPLKWQSDVGSVLVARQDGIDLTCQQAQIIVEYCEFHLQTEFEASLEATNVEEARRDVVRRHLNKETFLKYFERFKKEMMEDKFDGLMNEAAEDPSWANVVSPYDV